MKIGNYSIYHVIENCFLGDGGAMYGIVPKKIWSKFVKPDEDNLIHLHTNIYLIEGNGKHILIDTGFGNSLDAKAKRIYGVTRESGLGNFLKQKGLDYSDITDVVLTHLHFDHASGLFNENELLFPDASIWINKKEYYHSQNTNERTKNAYPALKLSMLEKSTRVNFIRNDETEISKNIFIRHTGGHTEGHQIVEIKSKNEIMVFPGDIMPNRFFAKIPYVSATDLYPLETMLIKKKIFKSNNKYKNLYFALTHESEIPVISFRNLPL